MTKSSKAQFKLQINPRAISPFYIESRPEKAPRNETFSHNLKVMTAGGKIKPHTFFTHISHCITNAPASTLKYYLDRIRTVFLK